MNKLILSIMAFGFLFLMACGGSNESTENETTTPVENKIDKNIDEKGVGRFRDIELTHPLSAGWVKTGEEVYNMKCLSCHKLTDEKLVGPGWKGVTGRHSPEWIMNFTTNVEEMLEKSPKAQKMLEECLVKMPNQNLSDDEARAVLEFMRKNDGEN